MELSTRRDPEGVLLAVRGRFDAAEATAFHRATSGYAEQGLPLLVDLSEVAFIDSTALAELVRLARLATEAGGSLRLVDPSAPATVVLQLSGLVQALTVGLSAPQAG